MALTGARPHVAAAAQNIATAVGKPDMRMDAFNLSMAEDHPQGLAVDFVDTYTIGNPLLEGVVAYATTNATALGIRYIAWEGRIYRPGAGWSPQTIGYGNDPQHRRHVHISFLPEGGDGSIPVSFPETGMSSGPSSLAGVNNAAKWLSNSHNWYRIGLIALGAILVLMALMGFSNITEDIKSLVSTTGKVAG